MKTWRYLLILVAISSVLFINAQPQTRYPQAQMQSTSSFMGAGSSLPQAAVSGTYITGPSIGSYSPTSMPGGPRRSGENPFGDNTIDDVNNPLQPGTPIGDGVWVMTVLAIVYAGWIARKRRKVKAPFFGRQNAQNAEK